MVFNFVADSVFGNARMIWNFYPLLETVLLSILFSVPHPCYTRPCLNDGICIDSYSGYNTYPENWNHGHLHYLCICRSGYTGSNCEGRRQSHDIGTQQSTPAEKTDTFTRKCCKLLIIYRGVWEMYRNAFIYQRSITVP